MGRTPILTRTDLLVSHELSLADRKRLRLELNIQNLFNQKTATHIFNYLNKGAPAGGQTRPANAIDFSEVNLAAGYDYNALILRDAGRRGVVRPALRDGRPVQPRNPGTVQREVHLLIVDRSGRSIVHQNVTNDQRTEGSERFTRRSTGPRPRACEVACRIRSARSAATFRPAGDQLRTESRATVPASPRGRGSTRCRLPNEDDARRSRVGARAAPTPC